jgi:hypothetical protein
MTMLYDQNPAPINIRQMHYYFSIANMVVQVTPRIIIFLGFVKYVHTEGDPPTVSTMYIISKMSVDNQ